MIDKLNKTRAQKSESERTDIPLIPEKKMKTLAADIISALHFLHGMRILHRLKIVSFFLFQMIYI